MSTSPGGLVSLSWDSRSGYGYRIETSEDLDEWQPLGSLFGTGGTLSIPVAQITLPQGGPPPPPAPANTLHNAHFVLRPFPGLNKTLVAWNQPGQTGLSQALLAVDFSTNVNLPLFFGKFTDAPNATDYLLSFTFLGGPFHPSFDDFTLAALNPEEAARLAWLTDRLAEVKLAMEEAQANGQATNGVPAAGGSPGGGVHLFFRVVETYADSDGDGLLDHHERDVTGTDPYLADSDHDGFSDGEEFAAGSDPHDVNSTPTTVGSGGVPPGSDLPPDEDEDGDFIPNALDADPLDKYVDWERRPFPNFLVLPIPGSDSLAAVAVNNHGHVVLNNAGGAGATPGGASHWKPGDSSPTALKLGPDEQNPLTISARFFNGYNEVGKPVSVFENLTLTTITATDVNDLGVIVGHGVFARAAGAGGGTPTSPETGGIGGAVTVALQWDTAIAAPTLVHPGFVDITQPGHNWGDLLLDSEAVEIINLGTIVGHAEFAVPDPELEPPFSARGVPTQWETNQIGTAGQFLFDPTVNPAPTVAPDRIHPIRNEYFGQASGFAAYWYTWTSNPGEIFQTAGVSSVSVATMPNTLEAAAGSLRLMLRQEDETWEPSLRTFSEGFGLNGDGVVWLGRDAETTLWYPMEKKVLQEIPGLQGYTITRVADVTDKNVAVFESNTGNVLLMPLVAIVTKPQAGDPPDPPHPGPKSVPWKSTDLLRIAKFGGGELIGGRLFLENEPDVFRLFLCGLPVDFSPRVTVRTVNLPAFADAHNDNPTAVSLAYDPLLGGFATETMFLVTGNVDDDHFGDDVGADDQLDDRSHKLLLGGEFIVEQLQYRADKPLVSVDTRFPIPLNASVTITIIPVIIEGLQALPDSMIEMDIEAAREVYSQVGLQLNVTIAHPLTVPGTVQVGQQNLALDLTDGLDIPVPEEGLIRSALTDEEKAFLTHAASSGTDDIQVFYIRKFKEVPSGSDVTVGGFAYISYEVNGGEFNPGTFRNSIIIARDPRSRYTLAHELGHVLTADVHVEEPDNLMFRRGSAEGDITDSKRLSEEQEAVILMSPLLDDND